MANRTDRNAIRPHGTDPQALIPQIVRDKIYSSRYWKEQCFALNAESIVNKAFVLDHIGFCFGGLNRPCPFLCLLTKMLQISPGIDVVKAYIEYSEGKPSNLIHDQTHDFRYLRALAIAYLRLVGSPSTIYASLEPMYSDYRKLNVLTPAGTWEFITIDMWVEVLLNQVNEPIHGFLFPTLTRRSVIEARKEIGPYVSPLMNATRPDSVSNG